MKREAQGKKAEFDLQAKKAAEVALLKTLASKPGTTKTLDFQI